MNFLPVKGYESSYEVSDTGIVRSIDRIVTGKNGVCYPFKGRMLRPHPNKETSYLQLSLWKDNIGPSFYVHRLVAEAHIPNLASLPEVNHKNGMRQDNVVTNLEWVTSSGNSYHAVQLGLRTYTHRMTSEEFVECLFNVINGESYASISARTPYMVPYTSIILRRTARDLGLEDELNASLYEQKAQRARINGAKHQGKSLLHHTN